MITKLHKFSYFYIPTEVFEIGPHFFSGVDMDSKKLLVKITLLLQVLVFTLNLFADESTYEFEAWVEKQYQISITKMLANFNRPDTVKGTIVAALSYENPNYYYHWVRDASVAIGSVFFLLNIEKNESLKNKYKNYINDFIEVTKIHQNHTTWAGLGEVKFMPNGFPYEGPWMRPQSDGAAIRALVLSYYANSLLKNGQEEFVRKNLFTYGC